LRPGLNYLTASHINAGQLGVAGDFSWRSFLALRQPSYRRLLTKTEPHIDGHVIILGSRQGIAYQKNHYHPCRKILADSSARPDRKKASTTTIQKMPPKMMEFISR